MENVRKFWISTYLCRHFKKTWWFVYWKWCFFCFAALLNFELLEWIWLCVCEHAPSKQQLHPSNSPINEIDPQISRGHILILLDFKMSSESFVFKFFKTGLTFWNMWIQKLQNWVRRCFHIDGTPCIFWEGHKILRNLHLTFACMYSNQK